MLKAPSRILPQAAVDDLLQIGRSSWNQLANGLWFLFQDGRQRGHLRVTLKRLLPGDHLVKHRAEAEDVRTGIDLLPFRLLGRHVGDCPDNRPFFRLELQSCVLSLRRSPTSVSFARPKSKTFTRPSSVTITLVGFRSRWMMPAE